MKRYDVCIVGAGAAGLAAAASLNNGIRTCLLEKNGIPGRKIMATGGGRCNITNAACAERDLTLEFFKSIGLETYADGEGRYFPYSNYAPDVVEILLSAIDGEHTDIVTDAAVYDVEKAEQPEGGSGYFRVSYRDADTGETSVLEADNVLLAMGGKAAPQFGTTGDGYAIARALGHSVRRVYPVLTAIECGYFRDIKGVRARGKASLYRDGSLLASEMGEIQFTEDGVSGICIFNLTPYIRTDDGESFRDGLGRFSLRLDLAPDFTDEQIGARKDTFGILCGKLAKRVGTEDVKCWELPVKGVKGWKNAQCTAGGVALDEIDMKTMGSMLVDGLFFAGEMIDVQGPCGGYNLQNAWETGIKAARAINANIKSRSCK